MLLTILILLGIIAVAIYIYKQVNPEWKTAIIVIGIILLLIIILSYFGVFTGWHHDFR